MTKISARLAPAAAAAALIVALAAGQASAATATTKTAKVRSPESIACSQQADAKGLHGKERKAFRATCKKQLAAAHNTTAQKIAPASAQTPAKN